MGGVRGVSSSTLPAAGRGSIAVTTSGTVDGVAVRVSSRIGSGSAQA